MVRSGQVAQPRSGQFRAGPVGQESLSESGDIRSVRSGQAGFGQFRSAGQKRTGQLR